MTEPKSAVERLEALAATLDKLVNREGLLYSLSGRRGVTTITELRAIIEELKKRDEAIEAELTALRTENERLLERKCANCGMPPRYSW